jgi:hypothetical protein
VTLASTGSATQVFSAVNNLRQVHVFASQLYASSASGTTTRGVLAIGSGLPTTAGQTSTQIAGDPAAASPNSFAVLDLDTNVAGVDTIYLALDVGGMAGKVNIQKWTNSGTAWSQVTAFAPTVTGTAIPNALGLATWLEGTAVRVIVTTSESPARILSILDDGVNTTPAATVLATAVTNTAFRGVARSPTQ